MRSNWHQDGLKNGQSAELYFISPNNLDAVVGQVKRQAAEISPHDETPKVLTDLVRARLFLVKIRSCGDFNAVIGQAGFEAVGK